MQRGPMLGQVERVNEHAVAQLHGSPHKQNSTAAYMGFRPVECVLVLDTLLYGCAH